MILKMIIVYAIIIAIGVGMIWYAYHEYQRAMFCNNWLQLYMQNPPTNPMDYANQDYTFDELCGTGQAYNWVGFGMVVMILGVLFLRRRKKSQNKQNS